MSTNKSISQRLAKCKTHVDFNATLLNWVDSWRDEQICLLKKIELKIKDPFSKTEAPKFWEIDSLHAVTNKKFRALKTILQNKIDVTLTR